jgi:hypothetical protein
MICGLMHRYPLTSNIHCRSLIDAMATYVLVLKVPELAARERTSEPVVRHTVALRHKTSLRNEACASYEDHLA